MAEKEKVTIPHVYKGLVEVSKALSSHGVGKDGVCAVGRDKSFQYRSITAFYSALSPALAAAGLIVITEKEEIIENSTITKGNFSVTKAVLKETYRIFSAVDGSSVLVESLGEALDYGDKAIGKCKSYAYKTAMEKLFCIPIDGQDDPDKDSYTIPAQAQAPVKAPKTAPAQALNQEQYAKYQEAKKGGVPVLTQEQIAKLQETVKKAVSEGSNSYHALWEELSNDERSYLVKTGWHEAAKESLAKGSRK